MDEIIRIFAKGLIRYIEKEREESSSDKSAISPSVRLDVMKNERQVVMADNRHYLNTKGQENERRYSSEN